jgi:SAM-dependent methyltransferase
MLRTPVTAASHIVAGAEYVAAINAHSSDRRYRAAFQQLALRYAPRGGAILDFGAGPGLDARVYGESGRRVLAYDVDERMYSYLCEQCAALIAQRLVSAMCADYGDFLTAELPQVDLVTANFAPLNLIDDLHGLFAKFHAVTNPGGAVLASVLSPYYAGDLGYRWWWRNLARLVRDGRYFVPGTQARIWRRRLADFSLQAAPYFFLERVFPGNLRSVPARMPGAWLTLATARFAFLLLRRA